MKKDDHFILLSDGSLYEGRMRTKQVKIADLKLADYNPRQITDHDMASLVNSIREFGMVEPVVVNKNNTVIGGHQRLVACQQLSITQVPVVYVDLPKKKEKILNLTLNRVHGDWDMGKLSIVLEELKLGNGDEIGLTGFELGEIDEIIDSQIPEDEGEDNFDGQGEAAKIKKPISKRGEVYQLGRHRLMCGDATVKADVEKLMDGKKADMVFTDPPYNVNIDYGQCNDNKPLREYEVFSLQWLGLCRLYSSQILFTPGTGRGLGHPNIQMWFRIAPPDWILCWVKKNAVGHSSLGGFNNWEPLFFYGQVKNKIPQDIYDIPITVQADVADSQGSKLHPTPKQVKLWVMVLKDFTNRDDSVADFFGGSGTTLIAAEKTGRVCYMMEIDPVYCDVIQKRYEEYVGENGRKTT